MRTASKAKPAMKSRQRLLQLLLGLGVPFALAIKCDIIEIHQGLGG